MSCQLPTIACNLLFQAHTKLLPYLLALVRQDIYLENILWSRTDPSEIVIRRGEREERREKGRDLRWHLSQFYCSKCPGVRWAGMIDLLALRLCWPRHAVYSHVLYNLRIWTPCPSFQKSYSGEFLFRDPSCRLRCTPVIVKDLAKIHTDDAHDDNLVAEETALHAHTRAQTRAANAAKILDDSIILTTSSDDQTLSTKSPRRRRAPKLPCRRHAPSLPPSTRSPFMIIQQIATNLPLPELSYNTQLNLHYLLITDQMWWARCASLVLTPRSWPRPKQFWE